MRRFVEGIGRGQATLFPECLADENNPVRVIDAFFDKLDYRGWDLKEWLPRATGRPSYHPAVLLKLYIYGLSQRVQSSRRLEREAGRYVEVMRLTGRLTPDHSAIHALSGIPCTTPPGRTMKLLTEYLDRAVQFENIAAVETDPKFKEQLEKSS
jgi:Transposase domain (DUF772)